METAGALQTIGREPESLSIFDNSNRFEHFQRVAKALVKSTLVPEHFRGETNIPNALIALDMADRLQANPMMVMQSLYVVHGKPGWAATFIISAVNTCGRFQPLRFDVQGTGKDRACIAWAAEKGVDLSKAPTLARAREIGLPVLESPPVSIQMATDEGWLGKSGSKWKTMPDLMLRYRAATFFGRLYCPELLLGMRTIEEVVDIDEPMPAKIVAAAPEFLSVPEPVKEQLAEQESAPAPAEPQSAILPELRRRLKRDGITEAQAMKVLRDVFSVEESLASLQEVSLVNEAALKAALAGWDAFSAQAKGVANV